MTAPRLILLLLLILVAVVLVVLVLRRGSAQRDAQRVEAAGLRTDADTLATTVAGQSVFADQAAQRAELARVEAEDKARVAAQLEAEAAEHRAAAEATQREYEATMRRADDIDPDVKKSEFPEVADDEGADEVEAAPALAGSTDAAPAPAASGAEAEAAAAGAAAAEQDELPKTRAERREAREAGLSRPEDEAGASGAADEARASGAADEARASGAADEAETGSGWGAPSAASSTAAAGAAGGAAAGAAAWAARGDDESEPESERIATAADFRDDVSGDPAEEREEAVDEGPAPGQEHDGVYAADDAGTEGDMSDDSRTETAEHASHDDGLEAGGGAATASAGAGGAYAATRALHEETANEQADRADVEAADGAADRADAAEGTADRAEGDANAADAAADRADRHAADGTADRADGDADAADGTADRTDSASTDDHATHDSDTSQEPGDDLSHDVESPRGEWGGPRKDEPAEMTVISEPEAYATTEPVMASDQTPPVTRDRDDTDREAGDGGASDREAGDREPRDGEAGDREAGDREATDRAPAEAGAAVVETDDTDRSAADVAEESNEERYDPTPTRDWAADEGELLEETHDRGDRLEAERADLAHQSDDAAASHDATASDDATDATASPDATDAAASDDASDATAAQGRRISAFDELRDGGFGVGSAAPLDDGAQPLDHPVQAYRDTMTYRLPGDAGYDSAEPHVWFYDEAAAEHSGFRRSEG